MHYFNLNVSKKFIAFIFFLQMMASITAYYELDRITNLPGIDNKGINFQHFAGFLNATGQHQLFYVFATSQNDPTNDPLLLWLNGGPGCSSLMGLLKIHGPYLVNADGRTLRRNPWAWNKNASVIYLEAPIYTGFSRTLNDSEELTWSDDQTSLDIYTALKFFLINKFPTFAKNKFFIAGESHAGIYVPTLAKRILEGNSNYSINLEGIAIGNGCTNDSLLQYTNVEFSYAHGLIDEQKFTQLEQKCNGSSIYDCNLDIIKSISTADVSGIYPYDIYAKCVDAEDIDGITLIQSNSVQYNVNRTLSVATHFAQLDCENDIDVWAYLNQDIVRHALNIPQTVGEYRWEECSPYLAPYQRQYDGGVEDIVKNIVNSGVRVLLYYGDTDLVCNALLGQKFAESLNFSLVVAKSPWYFDGQVGGMATNYNNGSLIYTTVRGAGHMAPINKGGEMLYAINQFMQNKTL